MFEIQFNFGNTYVCLITYICFIFFFLAVPSFFFQNPFELLANNKIPLDSSTQNIKSSKIKKTWFTTVLRLLHFYSVTRKFKNFKSFANL